MKCNVIVVILFVVNEVFAGGAAWGGSKESADPSGVKKNSLCNDVKVINDNLSAQYFNEKEESEGDLLELLRVKIIDDPDVRRGVRFVGATRISGPCANHVDDTYGSNYHFDTGIYMWRNEEGFFSPREGKYKPRLFVGKNNFHPYKENRNFIKAITVSGRSIEIERAAEFIGVWEEDGRSILTPYKRLPSGEFHIYNDIVLIENEILFIDFFPHPHGPTGAIEILVQDGEDRVKLLFSWVFQGLFYEMN